MVIWSKKWNMRLPNRHLWPLPKLEHVGVAHDRPVVPCIQSPASGLPDAKFFNRTVT
jgi:hypothetical protein